MANTARVVLGSVPACPLMACASGLAQEYGYSMLEWQVLEWQVLDWNEPAIGFYEGLGADRVKDRFTYRLTGNNLRNLNTLD